MAWHGRRNPDATTCNLDGFGTLSKAEKVFTADTIVQCVQYDEAVDRVTQAQQKKKRRRRAPDSADDAEEDAEEQEQVQPPDGWPITEGEDTGHMGIPACDIVIAVSVRLTTDNLCTLHNFCTIVKTMPVSVAMDILRPTSGIVPAIHIGGKLTAAECESIVNGQNINHVRPTLSGGDLEWSEKTQQNIHALPSEYDASRLSELNNMIALGYTLTLSRATGSDGFTNDRVAAIGKSMSARSPSINYCKKLYDEARAHYVGACRRADAISYGMHKFEQCNENEWSLRPGNLQNLLHLVVSDIMQGMAYIGGCFQGAENGIGGTLMWSDGGNNHRTLSKVHGVGWTMQTIRRKNKGCGADFVLGMLIQALTLKNYDHEMELSEWISELKQTSGHGLLLEVCHVLEQHVGGETKLVHLLDKIGRLTYTTELQAQNTPSALACLQALSWLITRNTITQVSNILRTTRADDSTGRVKVTYMQVMNGYLALASNNVGTGAVGERVAALNSVVRQLCSCSGPMGECSATETEEDRRRGISNGRQAYMTREFVTPEQHVNTRRPLFYTCINVAHFTAMMQWVGIGGRHIAASAISEIIYAIFLAQLDLSKGLLNPDKCSAGEVGRACQISKARGVATSLFYGAIEASIEAGRKGLCQKSACRSLMLQMMTQNIHPTVLQSVIADTVHHMVRVDFVIAMQLMCSKLNVPEVSLVELCDWLRDGTVQRASKLETWLQAMEAPEIRVTTAPLDKREQLTPAEHCMYVSTRDMRLHVPDTTETGLAELDGFVCSKLGSMLFNQFTKVLDQKCQIEQSSIGESTVQGMFFACVNEQIQWPPVFGNIDTWPDFWKGSQPSNINIRDSCALAPMQIIRTDRTRALLAADMRWLLLISALCGPSPSQSSISLLVSTWTQHFFRSCVPDHIMPGSSIITGLVSPWMQSGFLNPLRLKSERQFLRRPIGGSIAWGTTASVRTGLVEDYGAAEPLYALAKLLKVPVDSIVDDDAYCCSFPEDIWTPVALIDGRTASLKLTPSGRFLLASPADISADDDTFVEQVPHLSHDSM